MFCTKRTGPKAVSFRTAKYKFSRTVRGRGWEYFQAVFALGFPRDSWMTVAYSCQIYAVDKDPKTKMELDYNQLG